VHTRFLRDLAPLWRCGLGYPQLITSAAAHFNWFRKFLAINSRSVPSDVHKLYYSCSGKSCKFCEWRRQNPISLGWESLFEPRSHKEKPGKPISYDEEFVVDEEVIKAVEEIEYIEASKSTVWMLQLQEITNQELNRNVFTAHPNHKQRLKKRQNWRQSTKWAVGVWEDWAKSRNQKFYLKRNLLTVALKSLVCKKWTFGCDLF